MHGKFGASFVLLFVLGQAVRDAYFANIFQGRDFFEVALLTFSVGTGIFAVVACVRTPSAWQRFRGHLGILVWVNLTTGVAWLAFFYAIKHLEPAVASTLYMGAGPLTILALSLGNRERVREARIGRLESCCYVGLALTMAALWLVVLAGASGIDSANQPTALIGLTFATLGGALITHGHFGARRLNDAGIGSDAVMATRFLGIVLIAALVELLSAKPVEISTFREAATLTLAAVLLIVLPSFALQLGVARASPLTVNVVRALGPALLFFVQLADARIAYAPATLACVTAYVGFVVGANGARGWQARAALTSRRSP